MTGLPGSGYLGETSGAGAGMVLGEGDLCLAMLKGFQGPRSPHTGTCGLEDARVAEAVARGERLHHPVDLLGLARQPEAPEELPEGGAGLWAAGRVGLSGDPGLAALPLPGSVSLSCKCQLSSASTSTQEVSEKCLCFPSQNAELSLCCPLPV